jgi:hypothetical protein
VELCNQAERFERTERLARQGLVWAIAQGAEEVHIVAAPKYLTMCLGHQGRLQDAEQLALDGVTKCEGIVNCDTPTVLQCRIITARVQSALCRHPSAFGHFQEAVRLSSRIVGPEHKETKRLYARAEECRCEIASAECANATLEATTP